MKVSDQLVLVLTCSFSGNCFKSKIIKFLIWVQYNRYICVPSDRQKYKHAQPKPFFVCKYVHLYEENDENKDYRREREKLQITEY